MRNGRLAEVLLSPFIFVLSPQRHIRNLKMAADFFDRNKVGLVGVQCPLGGSGSRRASVVSVIRLLSFGEGPNEDQGKPGLTVKQEFQS